MPKATTPELKKVLPSPAQPQASVLEGLFKHQKFPKDVLNPKYMDKRLFVQLNGSRKVIGVLRGYDVFLNVVLDEAYEEKSSGQRIPIGTVVIRGNSVVMIEALERL